LAASIQWIRDLQSVGAGNGVMASQCRANAQVFLALTEYGTRKAMLGTVDDGLLSFFAATFAPVKFERSPEQLAETLLR
jgi:hypothetical protein